MTGHIVNTVTTTTRV